MPLLDKFKQLFRGGGASERGAVRLPACVLVGRDPLEHWQIVGELGDGAFGKVRKARDCRPDAAGRFAAAKVIEVEEDENIADFMVELDILSECVHKNVVALYESYFVERTLWMLLEFCAGGAVDQLMVELERPLTEAQIRYVCHEVVDGLRFLHACHVIHRDLKAGNILLTADGSVKLADFGVSAKNKSAAQRRDSFIGTPYWMAPEVMLCETFKDTPYGTKADIWSLGVTLIEMAQMEPPNSNVSPMRVLIKVQKSAPPMLDQPAKWSREFSHFLSLCLLKEPDKRSTATDLLGHAFIRQSFDAKAILDLLSEARAEVVEEHVEEMMLDEDRESRGSVDSSDVAALTDSVSESEQLANGAEPRPFSGVSLESADVYLTSNGAALEEIREESQPTSPVKAADDDDGSATRLKKRLAPPPPPSVSPGQADSRFADSAEQILDALDLELEQNDVSRVEPPAARAIGSLAPPEPTNCRSEVLKDRVSRLSSADSVADRGSPVTPTVGLLLSEVVARVTDNERSTVLVNGRSPVVEPPVALNVVIPPPEEVPHDDRIDQTDHVVLPSAVGEVSPTVTNLKHYFEVRQRAESESSEEPRADSRVVGRQSSSASASLRRRFETPPPDAAATSSAATREAPNIPAGLVHKSRQSVIAQQRSFEAPTRRAGSVASVATEAPTSALRQSSAQELSPAGRVAMRQDSSSAFRSTDNRRSAPSSAEFQQRAAALESLLSQHRHADPPPPADVQAIPTESTPPPTHGYGPLPRQYFGGFSEETRMNRRVHRASAADADAAQPHPEARRKASGADAQVARPVRSPAAFVGAAHSVGELSLPVSGTPSEDPNEYGSRAKRSASPRAVPPPPEPPVDYDSTPRPQPPPPSHSSPSSATFSVDSSTTDTRASSDSQRSQEPVPYTANTVAPKPRPAAPVLSLPVRANESLAVQVERRAAQSGGDLGPRKSPYRRTVTKKTRVYTVDGVQVTSTTFHVMADDGSNVYKAKEDHNIRKVELQELKRLQREEARQHQELADQMGLLRDQQEKRFIAEKQSLEKASEADVENLVRTQKRQIQEAERLQDEELRAVAKRLRADQERELKLFREQMKQETKIIRQEAEMHPKANRKEIMRQRKDMMEQKHLEDERHFVEQLQFAHDQKIQRLQNTHRQKIALLERQFLQQKHQVLRGREAALWELEERQLQERNKLCAQQVREVFFVQRSQMIARHQQELEHARKLKQRKEDELLRAMATDKKRLPKMLRSEQKTRTLMFKESLRISMVEPSEQSERLRRFDDQERRRVADVIVQQDAKGRRRLDQLRAKIDADIKELEHIQNEKRKMLLDVETVKLKQVEGDFTQLMDEWKSQLKPRKQELETSFAQELHEQDSFYNLNGTTSDSPQSHINSVLMANSSAVEP